MQAGDLVLAVGDEDCLEVNAASVEAKLTSLLTSHNQAAVVCYQNTLGKIVLYRICTIVTYFFILIYNFLFIIFYLIAIGRFTNVLQVSVTLGRVQASPVNSSQKLMFQHSICSICSSFPATVLSLMNMVPTENTQHFFYYKNQWFHSPPDENVARADI